MTREQCLTCATTHRENGQEVPGTMHCKDEKYAHLMSCSCWDYTARGDSTSHET